MNFSPSRSCVTFQPFNLASYIRIQNPVNKTKTNIQLKNDANMEILQPTKQNDIVKNSNNYKVLKNKHTTDEDKNKQIHSQINKIETEHLKNIIKKLIQKTKHDGAHSRHEHY